MIRTLTTFLFLSLPLASFAKEVYMDCEGQIYKHDTWKETIEVRRDGQWQTFCFEYSGPGMEDSSKNTQKGKVWEMGGECQTKIVYDDGRTTDRRQYYDFLFPSIKHFVMEFINGKVTPEPVENYKINCEKVRL